MKSVEFHYRFEIGNLVLLIFSLAVARVMTSKSCVCTTKGNWIVPENYDKNQAPYESENKPTEVFVNIDIMDIDQITEEKMVS
ncbi:hypothetical protein HNY73_001889 [Argiope bruennichi]|uniref:Uncharacterized protein n=1 Tax=Argiope bruennichi TaxID=94029 RepID=A0A8T0FRR9_ARGBR|nr:hypothetical protein HNY73_001889 [Argiope bruennichi]